MAPPAMTTKQCCEQAWRSIKTPANPGRRYLRARKFIPNEAFGQFKDTEDWRKENQLEKLYDTIDVSEYEQTRVLVSGHALAAPFPY